MNEREHEPKEEDRNTAFFILKLVISRGFHSRRLSLQSLLQSLQNYLKIEAMVFRKNL